MMRVLTEFLSIALAEVNKRSAAQSSHRQALDPGYVSSLHDAMAEDVITITRLNDQVQDLQRERNGLFASNTDLVARNIALRTRLAQLEQREPDIELDDDVSASLTTIALPSHHHRTTIALPSHYHRTTIALPSRYHRTTIALPSHYMFCRVYLATLFGCDALQGEDQEHAAALSHLFDMAYSCVAGGRREAAPKRQGDARQAQEGGEEGWTLSAPVSVAWFKVVLGFLLLVILSFCWPLSLLVLSSLWPSAFPSALPSLFCKSWCCDAMRRRCDGM